MLKPWAWTLPVWLGVVFQDGGATPDLRKLEATIAAEINKKRVAQSLAELKVVEELSYLARQQAEEFEQAGLRGHQGREWGFIEQRANALFGWTVPANQKPNSTQPAQDMMTDNSFDIDEAGHLSEGELSWVIDGWMGSAGHRQTIMMKTVVCTGVGISPKGTRIFQIFASLTPQRAKALEEIARHAEDLLKGETAAMSAIQKILALNEGAALVRLSEAARKSEHPRVRKKACEALFQLNKKIRAMKGVVPELMTFVEDETIGGDAQKCLQSLTGQSLGKDRAAWIQWWASARKNFSAK